MEDLKEAIVILGIKITRIESGISLDQYHYIEKILKKYNYFDCKLACTPYDPSVTLFKNTSEILDKQDMRASLVAFVMLLIALRPILHMLWVFNIGLLAILALITRMLLKE